jgi:hypothetical protein
VVDVRQDHGPPPGRDPTCEAGADRDPNALLDLLLEPDRGARDQLGTLLVEQQDRAVAFTCALAAALAGPRSRRAPPRS